MVGQPPTSYDFLNENMVSFSRLEWLLSRNNAPLAFGAQGFDFFVRRDQFLGVI